MTDRAQPGAQGSTLRNVEAGETANSLHDGFIVPSSDPTLSAQRFNDINEGSFAEFDASWSSSSLDVTINAGEAFIKGWLARDIQTTVTLDSFTNGQTVVLAWDADAVYDDSIHSNREDADRVIVTREADLPTLEVPYLPLYDFDTDGNGVTSATDRRVIGANTFGERRVPASFPTIDDFERGTLSGWLRTEDLSITNEEALFGNRSLVAPAPGGNGQFQTPIPVQRGTRLRAFIYIDPYTAQDGNNKYIDFQLGTSLGSDAERNDGYRFRLQAENESLKIDRYDGGTQNSLSSSSFTVPSGEWVIFEVELGLQDLQARVLDLTESSLVSISATDTTYYDFFYNGRLYSDETDVDFYVNQITRKQL